MRLIFFEPVKQGNKKRLVKIKQQHYVNILHSRTQFVLML